MHIIRPKYHFRSRPDCVQITIIYAQVIYIMIHLLCASSCHMCQAVSTWPQASLSESTGASKKSVEISNLTEVSSVLFGSKEENATKPVTKRRNCRLTKALWNMTSFNLKSPLWKNRLDSSEIFPKTCLEKKSYRLSSWNSYHSVCQNWKLSKFW